MTPVKRRRRALEEAPTSSNDGPEAQQGPVEQTEDPNADIAGGTCGDDLVDPVHAVAIVKAIAKEVVRSP
jgi:hypothetical protein